MRNRPVLIALALACALVLPAAASAKRRPLAPGGSGARVAAMQTYLAQLGYLPWEAVNGSYDYRTTHAVMAFQGWSGRTRDGLASVKTLKALTHARTPKPWRRYKGRRVEVHIDKQVVLLVDESNAVVRAIHVSTGAGGKTPEGDFSVYRKEEMSWSTPFSTWLPWASYFSGGFAFHEYPDVPGYPASHGCVRVPAPEAPVIFGFAGYGTPAHIHS